MIFFRFKFLMQGTKNAVIILTDRMIFAIHKIDTYFIKL
jgi:hypothetical protein